MGGQQAGDLSGQSHRSRLGHIQFLHGDDGDKYAGTWQHGDVGGHMFGTIAPPRPKHLPPKRSNLENRLVWLALLPWVETQVSRIRVISKLSLLLALLKDVRPRWGSACPSCLIEIKLNRSAAKRHSFHLIAHCYVSSYPQNTFHKCEKRACPVWFLRFSCPQM